MLDIMFELPEQEAGSQFVVDEDTVEGQNKLIKLPTVKSKSA